MKVKFGFPIEALRSLGITNPEDDFVSAKIKSWAKKPGDAVMKGELLAEVETDKVTADLNASWDGIIFSLAYGIDEAWELGVTKEGDELSERSEVTPFGKILLPELGYIETSDATVQEVPIGQLPDHRVRAAPAARKLALEHGIDINVIKGIGPVGRVTRTDVEAAIEAAKSEPISTAPESNDREPLHATQIRKAIAYYMQKSHAEIPKAGDAITVDVTNLWKFYRQRREIWREDTGTDFSFTGIFMYLATNLLYKQKDKFGIINAYWDKDEQDAYLLKHVNIGIAVQTQAGLMVPVIHSAETLSFREFMIAVHDKVQRSLAQKITLPELRDLTFTVNNVGAMGGESPDSIVPYTKESSGKERPTGMIMVLTAKWQTPEEKQYIKLAFSFDHRLFDGAPALEFVNALKRYIEGKNNPEEFRELFRQDFAIK